MSSNRAPIYIGILVVVVLLVLFAWPRLSNPNKGLLSNLSDAGIGCLTGGHTRAAQHFHPTLAVIVDGRQEQIDANIGIVPSCMAEIHTHDSTGTIHVETVSSDKVVYLRDFFAVWDRSIEREGFDVAMTVDGLPYEGLGDLIFSDGQQIILEYRSNR